MPPTLKLLKDLLKHTWSTDAWALGRIGRQVKNHFFNESINKFNVGGVFHFVHFFLKMHASPETTHV